MNAVRHRTNVLVIDDDEDLLTLIDVVLSRNGMKVYTVLDGEQGLRQLAQVRPDVIILDVMLPGMNGWAVIKQLRKITDVPVVMLTALTTAADRQYAFDLGAADYITKPFMPDDLLNRVMAVTANGAAN